ncbi:MAG TPA: DUF6801 domain-containing protein [Solirubrobacteraceae bacterium]|nr:DUF6801 domain-containing protein [Solirubrobacteraceae bacterium]
MLLMRRSRRAPAATAAVSAALLAGALLGAPAQAATEEKPYSASEQVECVLAPETISYRFDAQLAVSMSAPDEVGERQQFQAHGIVATLTLPAETGATIREFGATRVEGALDRLKLDVANATPGSFTLGGEAEGPLPLRAPVSAGEPVTLSAPASGAASSPQETVTGRYGTAVEIALAGEAGFQSSPERSNSYVATGAGLMLVLSGYNEAGEVVLSELHVDCSPVAATVAAIPISEVLPLPLQASYDEAIGGTITLGRSHQSVALPQGALEGSASYYSGGQDGSFAASAKLPSFTAPVRLLGLVPIELGMEVTQVKPFTGITAVLNGPPGRWGVHAQGQLALNISSLALFGLRLPVRCATAEPSSLEIAEVTTEAQALAGQLTLATGGALAPFECHGSFFDAPMRVILNELLFGSGSALRLES